MLMSKNGIGVSIEWLLNIPGIPDNAHQIVLMMLHQRMMELKGMTFRSLCLGSEFTKKMWSYDRHLH